MAVHLPQAGSGDRNGSRWGAVRFRPCIPPDKRSLVLEPFFKLDASRGPSTQKDFDLGLSIVSDIVKAHDGTLELCDRAPHGLVIRLRLPRLAAN
ncbi:ATP-binding protein [Aureimonas leprariae]|uniref:ATP-binding protein n=1 Tax=Plantimonas leprariae TaxID=2615207 RepID=UPI001FE57A70|nr:ATP-binding protein [Aureimonas leprariae]